MKTVLPRFAVLILLLMDVLLVSCANRAVIQTPEVILTTLPTVTETLAPSATFTPEPTATPFPPCYLSDPPAEIAGTYAIQGWQQFVTQAGIRLVYYYFPPDCSADALERDAQAILYGTTLPADTVGLVILHPVEGGTLGTLYQHLIAYEYWQMGPEDYPALLENRTVDNMQLIFLRVNELNGDNTIIGSPLTVMASLAEHEYIHIAQSGNNPDFARLVWTDKEYQAFIEGYANIGNASSQRYYFETKAAIEILQNLDLMNRNGVLQGKLESALASMNSSVATFNATSPAVYDRHVRAFFLRVSSQAYLDVLSQGAISPLALFTRAGSGDMLAYQLMKSVLGY